ncbi:hypothetical protein ACRE_016860 [Hapsidospora chrysogenum ATCC 11550]|uniref:Uncharacterized protein n=1 Tax=Hapsidospora chrysogenum (strain ATCC 11550 / CBS 779.69 / DSM 880 / IAM 14645 / JCM 23072 / IMI 49137) TaxID=857340 RepID=A0A086TDN6_HAPC1|nr:hypothetical protein ACRE_016860 [Hapsidospora chrysogenum ATCC 11550]
MCQRVLEAPLCPCGATFPPRVVSREYCAYSRVTGIFGACGQAIDTVRNPHWQCEPCVRRWEELRRQEEERLRQQAEAHRRRENRRRYGRGN